jgi:hypothetical protein
MHAKVVICGASTFCLWPALANSNGTVYLPRTQVIANGQAVSFPGVSNVHFISDYDLFDISQTSARDVRYVLQTLSPKTKAPTPQPSRYPTPPPSLPPHIATATTIALHPTACTPGTTTEARNDIAGSSSSGGGSGGGGGGGSAGHISRLRKKAGQLRNKPSGTSPESAGVVVGFAACAPEPEAFDTKEDTRQTQKVDQKLFQQQLHEQQEQQQQQQQEDGVGKGTLVSNGGSGDAVSLVLFRAGSSGSNGVVGSRVTEEEGRIFKLRSKAGRLAKLQQRTAALDRY